MLTSTVYLPGIKSVKVLGSVPMSSPFKNTFALDGLLFMLREPVFNLSATVNEVSLFVSTTTFSLHAS